MFTKLLVPLDRSPLAEQALGPAAAIARASGAEIDLVLVHQRTALEGLAAEADADAWKDEHGYLDFVASELTSGSGVTTTHGVLTGSVVETLCHRAADTDADLIVMTSHGRTGLSRAWLGSTADGIVRHSSIPVLVLLPAETKNGVEEAVGLPKHVLVLVDASETSHAVLPTAAALAKCGMATITLLRVVQPPTVIAPTGVPFAYSSAMLTDDTTPRLVKEAEAQLTAIASDLRGKTGLTVKHEVVVDAHVAPAIIDFVRGSTIDLIAMTTHGRGVSRLLVGSVADKILRGSGLPVVLYRPQVVAEGTPVPVSTTSSYANA